MNPNTHQNFNPQYNPQNAIPRSNYGQSPYQNRPSAAPLGMQYAPQNYQYQPASVSFQQSPNYSNVYPNLISSPNYGPNVLTSNFKQQVKISPVIEAPSNQLNRNRAGSSAESTVGLENKTGENNCFLNSIVQLLYHIEAFKNELLSTNQSTPVSLELKNLFSQISNKSSQISTSKLRTLLGYQNNSMDDATEAVERVISKIPNQTTFGHDILEQNSCPTCAKVSKTENFREVIKYSPAGNLVKLIELNQELNNSAPNSFATCVKLACGATFHANDSNLIRTNSGNEIEMVKPCPVNSKICPGSKKPFKSRKTLKNSPRTAALCIHWESLNPPRNSVQKLIKEIAIDIDVHNLYDSVAQVPDHSSSINSTSNRILQLSGVVCYYGLHYTVFVKNRRKNAWLFADDSNVKTVGQNWKDVVDKCLKGNYMPVLLIYSERGSENASVTVDNLVDFNQASTNQITDLNNNRPLPQVPKAAALPAVNFVPKQKIQVQPLPIKQKAQAPAAPCQPSTHQTLPQSNRLPSNFQNKLSSWQNNLENIMNTQLSQNSSGYQITGLAKLKLLKVEIEKFRKENKEGYSMSSNDYITIQRLVDAIDQLAGETKTRIDGSRSSQATTSGKGYSTPPKAAPPARPKYQPGQQPGQYASQSQPQSKNGNLGIVPKNTPVNNHDQPQSSKKDFSENERHISIDLIGEESSAISPFNAHIRNLYNQNQKK